MEKDKTMGSHFRVNATPVTYTFTLPTPSVTLTKRRPSWWNRLRKQPFGDWIVKAAAAGASILTAELFKRLLDLFLRVRTASRAGDKLVAPAIAPAQLRLVDAG